MTILTNAKCKTSYPWPGVTAAAMATIRCSNNRNNSFQKAKYQNESMESYGNSVILQPKKLYVKKPHNIVQMTSKFEVLPQRGIGPISMSSWPTDILSCK